MSSFAIKDGCLKDDAEREAIRSGFGRGLVAAGESNPNVWAAVADLTGSTKMDAFKEKFPERFVQVGIAEQNLVTVGAGMSAMGKIPFVSSYAAFNPGRNWEQIRTTVCLNDSNVKIIGSHAGISVGPDGATHQMLEDIALMRVLPNMMVVAPADALEAEKATIALAEHQGPAYMRLAREATPLFTTPDSPFDLKRAYVIKEGSDLTLAATGTMTYQALKAAALLEEKSISAEVLHIPVVKPLDATTVLNSVQKTNCLISVEEAQINGGLGGALAELLSENYPVSMHRIGIVDRFGESGDPDELLKHYKLRAEDIAEVSEEFVKGAEHGPDHSRN